MTARLIKELRVVTPIAVVGILAVLACSLFGDRMQAFWSTMVLCLFCTMVGVTSMGGELAHGMHLNLFVQPVSREQSWRDKTIVQGLVLVGLSSAYFWVVDDTDVSRWAFYLYADRFALAAVTPIFAFGCGTFFILTVRHVQGAFWFLVGAEVLVISLAELLWPASLWVWKALGLLIIFTALGMAGLVIGRQKYLAFENYSGLDNVLSMGADSVAKESVFGRVSQTRVLIYKELQLQWINLAVFLSAYAFGVVWGAFRTWDEWAMIKDFVVVCLPVFIGAAAVAEESRLGVLSWQVTLPPNRLRQWFLKLAVCLVLALGVGLLVYVGSVWLFPEWAVHGFLGAFSASGYAIYVVCAVIVGLFASSACGHYVQAAAVCVLAAIGALLDQLGVRWLIGQYEDVPSQNLFRFIGLPVLLVFTMVQGYRNFGSVQPTGVRLHRSLRGLTVCVLGTLTLTALLYHRAWEWLEPNQVRSAAAIPEKKAAQVFNGIATGVSLDSKGRLWRVEWKPRHQRNGPPAVPKFVQIGVDQDWEKVIHCRWTGYGYGVLKSNGTLWVAAGRFYKNVSEKIRAKYGELNDEPTLITPEFRWRSVAWYGGRTDWLGVRNDGTLWTWDVLSEKPEQRLSEPRQIGSDSDWNFVVDSSRIGNLAVKRDGSLWEWGRLRVRPRTNDYEEVVEPRRTAEFLGFKVVAVRGVSHSIFVQIEDGRVLYMDELAILPGDELAKLGSPLTNGSNVYVLNPRILLNRGDQRFGPELTLTDDGVLRHFFDNNKPSLFGDRLVRLDRSRDWIAWNGMWTSEYLGLKSDGSVWYWNYLNWSSREGIKFEGKRLKSGEGLLIPHRFRPVKLGMLDPKFWK